MRSRICVRESEFRRKFLDTYVHLILKEFIYL